MTLREELIKYCKDCINDKIISCKSINKHVKGFYMTLKMKIQMILNTYGMSKKHKR